MSTPSIQNPKIREYEFLSEMYADPYFPDFLVDKGKAILLDLCHAIEKEKPQDLAALYVLSHAATDRFNELEEEFGENDSEIETAAREAIAEAFDFVAITYGFDADVEELIATRDW